MVETQEIAIDFFNRGKIGVLGGRVSLQGRKIEVGGAELLLLRPLEFVPSLDCADIDNDYLRVLSGYLEGYRPATEKGFSFFPSARFTLYQRQHGIGLFMQGEENWASGEAIDLLDHSLLDLLEMERVIESLNSGRVSGFVMGKILERKEYEGYTVLRRYFKE